MLPFQVVSFLLLLLPHTFCWNMKIFNKKDFKLLSPDNFVNPKVNLVALTLSSIVFSQTPLMTTTTNFLATPVNYVYGDSTFHLNDIANARPEGVNRPDLLPQDKSQVYSVIDVANFLRFYI